MDRACRTNYCPYREALDIVLEDDEYKPNTLFSVTKLSLYIQYACILRIALSNNKQVGNSNGKNTFVFVDPNMTFCALFVPRCDTIEKLKAQLPKMDQELKDQGKFKDFYQFTFNFAKNPGQKGLGKNSVTAHRHHGLFVCCIDQGCPPLNHFLIY